MEKITFKNGQAPYINDTNLNKMQDNIENTIEARAIKNIKSQLTVDSTYFDEVDLNTVVRNGNVCRVDFRAKPIADIPDNTAFLSLPYNPAYSMTMMLGVGERYTINSVKWIYATSDSKNIKGGAISKSQYIHIGFTYICS